MKYILRELRISDLNALVHKANNKKIARYMTDRFPFPYEENDGQKFIEFAKADNGSFIKAIEVEGEFSGAVGLHQQTDVMKYNAELGYWIAEPLWNKGIITSAVQEFIQWGFANLDIQRIYARPYSSNVASQRVLDKLGFTLEARIEKNINKWGEWEDEMIYGIRRST